MKVKDVMNPDVVFCKPDDTVREAAKLLKENNISGAPVLEDGQLVGIVSEADRNSRKRKPLASKPF